MKIAALAGKRVAIWGAGKEGLAMARLLQARLPGQHLDILAEDPNSLAAIDLHELEGADLDRHAGPVTLERLRHFDVVIKSPGVSAYREEILAAKAAGVVFTSGTNIWFAENPAARTICVTGSKGKSTTSSVTAHLLASAGYQTVAAGNIGVPLVDLLLHPRPQPVEAHVVELSSYQLHDFAGSPEVSVLLNLFPEHLDWHHGEANYFRDKSRILRLDQATPPIAILNHADPNTRQHLAPPPRTQYFNTPTGYHVRSGHIYRGDTLLIVGSDIPLLGEHNLINVCAALTAVEAFGASIEKVLPSLKNFKPLPHRLTVVGERNGHLFVDDSIATIPQAAAAAIKAIGHRPVTIIVGGYDRGLDQAKFADLLLQAAPEAIITIPDTGDTVFRLLSENPKTSEKIATLRSARDLAEAVNLATQITPPGGVILLSPGAPSYNAFKNFEDRGFTFGELAGFSNYRKK
jgi:UDP-N-acetylmuramoylalanine--D-glutamate ligase